ncbi:hypothetical protein M7I_0823 [Glarea lozoyensis 74030]|uniref:Uncharacterized protein n=1 Tax=Glarea lozoyensis (strain ATCC 74030 / MF5533) TaxID=1104152 RepID=H0EEE8_GLAL7|nr:hypothetical protein M7I_0823 [Glarea lozoyensis 74030]
MDEFFDFEDAAQAFSSNQSTDLNFDIEDFGPGPYDIDLAFSEPLTDENAFTCLQHYSAAEQSNNDLVAAEHDSSMPDTAMSGGTDLLEFPKFMADPCGNCRRTGIHCKIIREGIRKGSCTSCVALGRTCSLNQQPEEKNGRVCINAGFCPPGTIQDENTDMNDWPVDDTQHSTCPTVNWVPSKSPVQESTIPQSSSAPDLAAMNDENGDGDEGGPKTGARFSREAVKVLRESLKRLTGLNKIQITNWLANARRRGKVRAPRSTSPAVGNHPNAMDIPRKGPMATKNMNPLERWKASPPEHEPASVTAIAQAFQAGTMESWKVATPEIRSRCGFCGTVMDSWSIRVDHLAEHFKGGKSMADWKGDWGFDTQVLDIVENGMPPYAEIQHQARWIVYDDDDPWNQTAADNAEWLMRFKRDVGLCEPSTGPGLPVNEKSWQLCQGGSGFGPPYVAPKENAELQFDGEVPVSMYGKGLAGRWKPPGVVFCSRELEEGLNKFMVQQISSGITPSDESIQQKAREILGQEETAADDMALLEKFKGLHGLFTSPTMPEFSSELLNFPSLNEDDFLQIFDEELAANGLDNWNSPPTNAPSRSRNMMTSPMYHSPLATIPLANFSAQGISGVGQSDNKKAPVGMARDYAEMYRVNAATASPLRRKVSVMAARERCPEGWDDEVGGDCQ